MDWRQETRSLISSQRLFEPSNLNYHSSHLPLGTPKETLYAVRSNRFVDEPYERVTQTTGVLVDPVISVKAANKGFDSSLPATVSNPGPGILQKLTKALNADDDNQVIVLASSVLGALILTLIFLLILR